MSIHGCIDPFATNYDQHAEVNDGSCTYNVPSDWVAWPDEIQSDAFALLHDVRINGDSIDPNEDAVGVYMGSLFLGFGHARGEWTSIPIFNGTHQEPMTIEVFDASGNSSHELSLDGDFNFTQGFIFYGGCMDVNSSNYNELATFDIGNCVQ